MKCARFLALAYVTLYSAVAFHTSDVICDVIVAGGSLASVAAAASASNASATARVCLLDITDWPGGQLTASAVPAVDFGPENGRPENIPLSLAAFLYGPLMPNTTNLGNCWVSKKCFEPRIAVDSFINPLLDSFPNLLVSLRTAVSFAERDPATGAITSILGVKRTPKAADEWDMLTSAQLTDWYSWDDSPRFAKELVNFSLAPSGVVVDATEFGDVLATAGLPLAQGIEVPAEDSKTYLSTCGQGTTIPFYATYGETLAPSPDPWPPGDGNGDPFSQQGMGWDRDFTYRRVSARAGSDGAAGSPGETSVINVGGGNDIGNAYLFYGLESAELAAQLSGPGAWRGGLNTTALARAEQRAYGFYHFFKANASSATRGDASKYITLNASVGGTGTGLSRMPYLRDTRRSAGGIGGFRVMKSNLSTPGTWSRAAVAWPDSIGIGQYFYADIHKEDAAFCAYPDYIKSGAPVLPYYIPFRALTVDGAPNLLVAGKTMAASFFANAAMRLHPEEWTSGIAAGVAAVTMAQRQWTTADALEHVEVIRAIVEGFGSPQNWTLTTPPKAGV